ncbi:MAG: hypothetical protein IKS74_05615 [Methanomicrobium sp.]|nr:hypothetical protein [Methanomicrobium sp.]
MRGVRVEEARAGRQNRDEALSNLEIIFVIAIAAILGYVILGHLVSPFFISDTGKGGDSVGIVKNKYTTANVLTRSGASYGMQEVNGTLSNVRIYSDQPYRDTLGSAAISLQLDPNYPADLEFHDVAVFFRYGDMVEELNFSAEEPLMPGCWVLVEHGSDIATSETDGGEEYRQVGDKFTLVINPSICVPENGVFVFEIVANSQTAFYGRFGVPSGIKKYGIVKLLV